MKTYIFDLVKRFKRTSEVLDAKTILCNKTWLVFSDSGEKEVYVFMEDGKLVISVNGVVTMGTWLYITANKSLVISGNGQSFLVHPFLFKNILALVQDGTDNCAFLLDDTISELENFKCLPHISKYIKDRISQTNNLSVSHSDSKYYFGESGKIVYCDWDNEHRHPYHYVEMRQVSRNHGIGMRGIYYWGNNLADVCAYSSDGKTFCAIIEQGKLKYLHYNENKRCSLSWECFEKLIENKRWFTTEYVHTGDYYLTCCYRDSGDLLSEEEWMSKNGKAFKKKLLRFRKELQDFLGFDPVSSPYWRQLGEL